MRDVVIIGGSFAGLSAATQLGRARRKVTILDTGRPRNRFAAHAHGILGHDGKPPFVILGEALRQMEAYPSIARLQAEAVTISGQKDGFAVTTADGETIAARRVILSYGVADQMPDLPGFAACWGRSVLHCPYCHGYEVADRRLGLLYFSPLSAHVAAMLRDWTGELTLFADGHAVPEEFRDTLARQKVRLVAPKVTELIHVEGQLQSVRLADGSEIGLDALFASPRQRPSASLHADLGIRTEAMPLGDIVTVSETYETSVPGIYAAGDLATGRQSVPLAMAAGVLAGTLCHHSLLD